MAAIIYLSASGRIREMRNVSSSQLVQVSVSTLAAMVCGTVILLYSLKNAPVSIVTVFQSMVPVFITLIVWSVMRERPSKPALLSVAAVMVGVGLVAWS